MSCLLFLITLYSIFWQLIFSPFFHWLPCLKVISVFLLNLLSTQCVICIVQVGVDLDRVSNSLKIILPFNSMKPVRKDNPSCTPLFILVYSTHSLFAYKLFASNIDQELLLYPFHVDQVFLTFQEVLHILLWQIILCNLWKTGMSFCICIPHSDHKNHISCCDMSNKTSLSATSSPIPLWALFIRILLISLLYGLSSWLLIKVCIHLHLVSMTMLSKWID